MSKTSHKPKRLRDNWLDSDMDLVPLHPSDLDPLADHDAPLLATCVAKDTASAHIAEQARLINKLQGPHTDVWQHNASIEAEVERLGGACRTSTGIERESNLRQLRDVESELAKFRSTGQFQRALGYMLNQLDAAVVTSAGEDLSEQQAEARAWYEGFRLRMVLLLANQEKPAGDAPETPPVPDHTDRFETVSVDLERKQVVLKPVTLKEGPNPRAVVDAWVKAMAPEYHRDGDYTDALAERIRVLAERHHYQSARGPITKESILRMLPPGITGPRGRRSTKTRKN